MTHVSTLSRAELLRLAAASTGALLLGGCTGDDASGPSAAGSSAGTSNPPPGTATAPAPEPTELRWRRLPPGPALRDHSLVVDPRTGVVYLFGGRHQDVAADEVWMLDITEGRRWRRIRTRGRGPAPRFTHVAAWDDGRGQMLASTGQGEGSVFFSDVWSLDVAARRWRRLDSNAGPRPAERYGAAGALSPRRRLLVSHGFTNSGRFDDTWAFDLESGRWSQIATTGAVPIRRCLTQAAWDGQRQQLILFAGQTDGDPFLGDLWTLDVRAGRWRRRDASSPPRPRNLFGAALDRAGRRWYVFGGDTDAGAAADLRALELDRERWAAVRSEGRRPAARISPALAFTGNALLLQGGNDGERELSDTWLLPLPAGT